MLSGAPRDAARDYGEHSELSALRQHHDVAAHLRLSTRIMGNNSVAHAAMSTALANRLRPCLWIKSRWFVRGYFAILCVISASHRMGAQLFDFGPVRRGTNGQIGHDHGVFVFQLPDQHRGQAPERSADGPFR